MIAFAIALLVALIASEAVWLVSWRKERAETFRREQALLNRLQFPERVPPEHVVTPPDEELLTAPDLGDWELAGTIQTGRDGDDR